MKFNSDRRAEEQLPKELWGSIVDSRLSVYLFRSVCRSWRSLLPLSHLQHFLSPIYLPHLSASSKFSLSYLCPFTICRLHPTNSPSSSCLTRAEESIHGQMQLLIPLSTQHPHQPKTLNSLDFRLIELGQFYSLKSPSGSPAGGVSKTLVLHKHPNSNMGLEILCLFRKNKLGFWRFGDRKWTIIDQENSPGYDDIILFRNQTYVVDKSGIVWWVKYDSLELIMYSPPLYLNGQKKNLVESEGHLYVVDRYLGAGKRVIEIRVFRLDEDWGVWVHVSCLGDRLFVLGSDCCFSANATGLCCSAARNSIFFTDSCDEDPNKTHGVSGYCTRIFRLYDRSIQKAAHSSDHVCSLSPPPAWFRSERDKWIGSLDLNLTSSQ